MRTTILLLFLVAMLLGCANLSSIHRSDTLKGKDAGKIIHTDAKQRAIVAIQAGPNGTNNHIWRICSEPPPDVFSALAASLAGEASLAESGDPLSKEIATQLSLALSENASTIERTQTINILRESMYRNCERYLSGAIGSSEFIVQAARDHRAIVAVLAIEQLTGVQKAQATALTTVAHSAVGGNSDKSIEILDNARKDKARKTRDAVEKRKAAEADNSIESCEAAKKSDDAAHKAKRDLCEEADKLDAEAEEAKAYYETVRKAIDGQGVTAAEVRGSMNSAAQSSSSSSAVVANVVLQIVENANSFDEVGMSCVVLFRRAMDKSQAFVESASGDEERKFLRACLERMSAEAKLEAARRDEEAALLEKRTNEILNELASQHSDQVTSVWNTIRTGNSVDPVKWARLKSQSSAFVLPTDERAILAAGSKEEFATAFGKLSPGERAKLSAYAGGQ